MPTTLSKRMSLVDCLAVLHAARREEIVITTMGAAREWQKLGKHPLDFVLVPSSMGQATSLGLGMALARPDRKVVVCNGDGSMLMNLGSLVTITAQGPPNLTVILFDNGVYEVTGVQPTLAAPTLRR
ncbi:MAG TPA: thiamine pyrophosphate-dependent enzyme, partial [Planctomycetaceae bacterium]|nr:thiamine pyrophosphate-dependent enzyme [Planctomycetaceae bacterium]